MPEIIEGNRPGEPVKPFSLNLGDFELLAKPLDKCNIESGTIQAGFFFTTIGQSYSPGAGLAFFIQNVSYDHWTMYIALLDVYNQEVQLLRYLDGTKTTIGELAFTIPLNQLVWLGVDFSQYSTDGAGLIKVHATAVEGNIIRADTLKLTIYDPGFTPGGSIGIYNNHYHGRCVDLTAGSPAHAEFADEARALRGTILAGDDRRVRYNEEYNRFEYTDDGEFFTPVNAALPDLENLVPITSVNRPGVTRLYRRDNDSGYSVQTHWTGSHWWLRGYDGVDNFHAECRVDSLGGYSAADIKTTGAVVQRTSDVSASGAYTVVWQNYLDNTMNGWDGSTAIYAQRTGWHLIFASLQVNPTAAVVLRQMYAALSSGGRAFTVADRVTSSDSAQSILNGMGVRYLTAGSYVQIVVNASSFTISAAIPSMFGVISLDKG